MNDGEKVGVSAERRLQLAFQSPVFTFNVVLYLSNLMKFKFSDRDFIWHCEALGFGCVEILTDFGSVKI